MSHLSKRVQDIQKGLDVYKRYTVQEAIEILKQCPPVKFDQSVEVSLKLGVDPKRSDQSIRGTVSLPHGTGKKIRILVLAKAGDKIKEALAAGADYAGHDEYIEKINGGWTDFDAVIATPDMMRDVGKLGKILGPRGLMPTPKAGNVTTDVVKAIRELKAGKIEFKLDRHGVINSAVGKLAAFSTEQLSANIRAFMMAVQKAKPASAKGHYMQSLVVSSTMGPGLKINLRDVDAGALAA